MAAAAPQGRRQTPAGFPANKRSVNATTKKRECSYLTFYFLPSNFHFQSRRLCWTAASIKTAMALQMTAERERLQMELQSKERLALIQQSGQLAAVDAKIDAENARTFVDAAENRIAKELELHMAKLTQVHEAVTQTRDHAHEVGLTPKMFCGTMIGLLVTPLKLTRKPPIATTPVPEVESVPPLTVVPNPEMTTREPSSALMVPELLSRVWPAPFTSSVPPPLARKVPALK
jgi:hypothetical protein